MKIEIFQTTSQVNTKAAWHLIRRAAFDGALTGIATGDTTKAVYALVAAIYKAAPFDTSNVRICALDDYVGVESCHPASCSARIRAQLQAPLHLRDDQLLLPDSFSGTPDEVAQAYEAQLVALGGIQMQLLGIGTDAHLGFCRPGTPFSSPAHAVQLPEDTRQMLHRKYNLEAEKLPRYGITLGLKSIMQVPELIVIATGKAKARAVYDSLRHTPDESIPASILQLHPNVTWLLDSEAAALL